jgi:hypothetical protein
MKKATAPEGLEPTPPNWNKETEPAATTGKCQLTVHDWA